MKENKTNKSIEINDGIYLVSAKDRDDLEEIIENEVCFGYEEIIELDEINFPSIVLVEFVSSYRDEGDWNQDDEWESYIVDVTNIRMSDGKKFKKRVIDGYGELNQNLLFNQAEFACKNFGVILTDNNGDVRSVLSVLEELNSKFGDVKISSNDNSEEELDMYQEQTGMHI